MDGVGRSVRAAYNFFFFADSPAARAASSMVTPAFFAITAPSSLLHVEHILRHIMVHVADLADVVVARSNRQLLRRQRFSGLVQRPREIVAVVVQRKVRVLRGIEAAALAVAQLLIRIQRTMSRATRANSSSPNCWYACT